MRPLRIAVFMTLAVFAGANLLLAQAANTGGAGTELPPDAVVDERPCESCPPHSQGHALTQTTLVNVIYGLANLARGQVTARITPASWRANMQDGWVWDLDDVVVNQIGHPYHGNNYFTSGRANGLSFYEAAAVAAFGSATWEYFRETNRASLNDFINTTVGGAALGEMFYPHRLAGARSDGDRARAAVARDRRRRHRSAERLQPRSDWRRVAGVCETGERSAVGTRWVHVSGRVVARIER